MGKPYYLIDFENVQPAGVGRLVPGSCRIKLFLGQNQAKVPVALMQALQPFGSDVEYVQIVGSGPNAVDFHVAFYIGRLASEDPAANYVIVSRDTGFDPLVRHLGSLKIKCRRVGALPGDVAGSQGKPAAAAAKPAAKAGVSAKPVAQPAAKAKKAVAITVPPVNGTPPANGAGSDAVAKLTELAVARLKSQKAGRPATVKTLQSSLKSWAPDAFDAAMLARVMDQLRKLNVVMVNGTKVSYRLG